MISVTATLSDGNTEDLTGKKNVDWKSSNDKIATVDNGTVTAATQGEVIITATAQDVPATMTVTVVDPVVTAMAVVQDSADIPLGLTQDFTATATLSDDSTPDVTETARWKSDDEKIVTVDKGTATAVSKGKATITATDQKISATAQINIIDAIVKKLVLDPRKVSQNLGIPQNFTATATLSDNTEVDVTVNSDVSWSSSDENVSTVEQGTALTLKTGSTTITALDQSVDPSVDASAELSVIDAIVMQLAIDPETASQPVGLTQDFTAITTLSDGNTSDVTTNPEVTWRSDDEKVATVTAGKATIIAPGTATITAKDHGFSDSAVLTVTEPIILNMAVTPDQTSIPVGLS